jgi:hypothetical protein
MMRVWASLSLVLWLASISVASSTDPGIRVELPDAKIATLTSDSLNGLRRLEITATAHGETRRYEGVDLLDALQVAGLIPTSSLRGKAVGLVVIVEGADGYQAVFALAELDPTIGSNLVLLADSADGRALPADLGTWRLVVPTDRRPTRWVWSIVRIKVASIS